MSNITFTLGILGIVMILQTRFCRIAHVKENNKSTKGNEELVEMRKWNQKEMLIDAPIETEVVVRLSFVCTPGLVSFLGKRESRLVASSSWPRWEEEEYRSKWIESGSLQLPLVYRHGFEVDAFHSMRIAAIQRWMLFK